jgi:hypothetical protein
MSTAWIISWVLIAIVAALAVSRLLLRGERVGDMRCKVVLGSQLGRVRFIVKRSGAEAFGIPSVELQSRITLRMSSTMLDDREAVRLAELIEQAEARVRAP